MAIHCPVSRNNEAYIRATKAWELTRDIESLYLDNKFNLIGLALIDFETMGKNVLVSMLIMSMLLNVAVGIFNPLKNVANRT